MRLGIVKKNRYIFNALSQISSLGFDCVQIMCHDPFEFNPNELKRKCQELGLEIASLGGNVDMLGSEWMSFRNIINIAAKTNTGIICLHSGAARDETSRETLIERLSRMTETACQNGIKLALENSPLHMIKTDDDLLDMVKSVDGLYINLDTGNLNLVSCDVAKACRKLGRFIIHTHIKDSMISEGKWVFAELGRGSMPIPAYLKALKSIRYRGPLVLEYEGNGNPLDAMKHGKKYIDTELMKIEK